MKEFILCAAIWINDGLKYDEQPVNIDSGFVICGRRHNNCYKTIAILKGNVNTYLRNLNLSDEDYRKQPGFITSLDRFVNRKEGWEIAKLNNQIQFGNSDNNDDEILISENLY